MTKLPILNDYFNNPKWKLWQSDKNVIYCRWIWDFRKMYFRRRAFYFSALKREWAEPNVMVGWKGAFKKKYRALTNLIQDCYLWLFHCSIDGQEPTVLNIMYILWCTTYDGWKAKRCFLKEVLGFHQFKLDPGLLPLVTIVPSIDKSW